MQPGSPRERSDGVADGDDQFRATGIRVHFGGIRAVDGVDLSLRRDEILGLIGPNGAGKTTLVNALTGFARPTEGTIEVDGRKVTGKKPPDMVRLGVVRTHQGVRLFKNLSVLENVEVGILGVGGRRARSQERALELLTRAGLGMRASARAGSLAHGDQRRVGILRALASTPAYLFLDEPAAGLPDDETEALKRTIQDLQAEFLCGVVVIEHDMRFIMELCHRVQVLDAGTTLAVGKPAEVQANPEVVDAYLGSRRGRQ